METTDDQNAQKFYHSMKASLNPRDFIEPGFNPNYGKRKKMSFIYLTATLDAATWGQPVADNY